MKIKSRKDLQLGDKIRYEGKTMKVTEVGVGSWTGEQYVDLVPLRDGRPPGSRRMVYLHELPRRVLVVAS